MDKRFAFCHGWTIDKNFSEVTWKRREKCQYYDVDFYRKHVHHLEEFEEMFPSEPCSYFLPRCQTEPKQDAEVDAFLALLKG